MRSIALAMLLLSPSGVGAQGVPLYSDAEVANYYGLIQETFASYANLLAIDDFELVYPGRGATPLSVYGFPNQRALGQPPDRDTIALPPETFLFLSDVFGIQSWYQRNGCDPLNILAYLWSVLNQHRPMGSPHDAFGLNRAAMPPEEEGPLSAVTLFLLAHEIAHVRMLHDSYATNNSAEAAEMAADSYALGRLSELGYNYRGALADYFNVAVFLDQTDRTRVDGVHLVTAARLNALGDAVIRHAATRSPDVQLAARQEAEALRQTATAASPDVMAATGEILMKSYPVGQWPRSCVKP